jgi:CrcB protein
MEVADVPAPQSSRQTSDRVLGVAPRRPVRHWDLVLACSIGGILGAWARYGLDQAIVHTPAQFPWSTVLINASGCFAIGVLMVVLGDLTAPHRLVRPFLGVGVLGGYTTYSTFAVDVDQLVLHHHPGTAVAYVVMTVAACLLAVWLSTQLTLGVVRIRHRRRAHRRSP